MNQSSLDAYEEVKPKISQSQKRILSVCATFNNPFCQQEILQGVQNKYSRFIQINSVTPRVNELVANEYLTEIGRLKSRFSSVSVTHYVITDKGIEFLGG